MKSKILITSLLLIFMACESKNEEKTEKGEQPNVELEFDKTKWKTKDGKDYPFRDQLVEGVLYNDTIRSLNKKEILNLLGNPDRIQENHLYYMISQKRLGSWPLNTRTLVIKFSNENTIDWIKLHE